MSIADYLVDDYLGTCAVCKDAAKKGIKVCNPYPLGGIQIGIGIEKLAAEVGETVITEPFDSQDWPIKKSFTYHDVTFFELGSESVETEAHNV